MSEPMPVEQLSLGCIDAVSEQVDWSRGHLQRWSYCESFKYTLDDRELVLISHDDGVVAAYTESGERIGLAWDSDIDEYTEKHTDDDGNLLVDALSEEDLVALRGVEPCVYGSEGPMMNYWYPIGEDASESGRYGDTPNEVDYAYRLRNLPVCVVERDGKLGLALTGGGMDLTWEICHAYVALGYAPPVAFADLPAMAGKPASDGSDAVVIEAVRRSLHAMIERMQYRLERHNEQYPAS